MHEESKIQGTNMSWAIYVDRGMGNDKERVRNCLRGQHPQTKFKTWGAIICPYSLKTRREQLYGLTPQVRNMLRGGSSGKSATEPSTSRAQEESEEILNQDPRLQAVSDAQKAAKGPKVSHERLVLACTKIVTSHTGSHEYHGNIWIL